MLGCYIIMVRRGKQLWYVVIKGGLVATMAYASRGPDLREEPFDSWSPHFGRECDHERYETNHRHNRSYMRKGKEEGAKQTRSRTTLLWCLLVWQGPHRTKGPKDEEERPKLQEAEMV
jgi:hypothetical protein